MGLEVQHAKYQQQGHNMKNLLDSYADNFIMNLKWYYRFKDTCTHTNRIDKIKQFEDIEFRAGNALASKGTGAAIAVLDEVGYRDQDFSFNSIKE